MPGSARLQPGNSEGHAGAWRSQGPTKSSQGCTKRIDISTLWLVSTVSRLWARRWFCVPCENMQAKSKTAAVLQPTRMPIRLPPPTRKGQIIRNLFLPLTRMLQTAAAAAKIFEHAVASHESRVC